MQHDRHGDRKASQIREEKLARMLAAAYVCYVQGRKSIDRVYKREVEGEQIGGHWIEVARHASSTANPAKSKDKEWKPKLLARMIAAAHLCYVRGGKSIDRVYKQSFQDKPIDEHWINVARHASWTHSVRGIPAQTSQTQ